MPTLPEGSVEGRWDGQLRDGQGREEAVLGTTDDAVVYRTESGRAGTFPREHVTAVESRVRTETSFEGSDYRLLVGAGAVLSALGFFGAVVTSSGLLAALLVLVGVGGLRLADYAWKRREEYEGIERVEREVEHVTVQVGGGVRRRFVLPMEASAGARLAEFVRDGSPERTGGEDPRQSGRQDAGPSVEGEMRASND